MKREELEDLVRPALEKLKEDFSETGELQEEFVITTACLRMTNTASSISILFSEKMAETEIGKTQIKRGLAGILCWGAILSWVLEVCTPLREDLQEGDSPWQPEVKHCGVLTSTMLQYKISQVMLDFFLSNETEVGTDEEDPNFILLSDIFSLVDLVCTRLNIDFLEVLNEPVSL